MIDEVNYLVNELDISSKHAEEIINIYFDEYAGEGWNYIDYLRDEIRVIRDKPENQQTIAELQTLDDDLCLSQGDDYILLTNYSSAVRVNVIGDFLPNHSF